MQNERIATYEEFWPHYLSEHRDPISRRMHFVGTSGFLASCVATAAINPIGFSLASLGFAAIFKDGMKKEGQKPSLPHVLGMVALPSMVSPIFTAGVVWAYGWAWAGHFLVEKNKPATFGYPLWSLFSDFKMYGHMLQGRLWSGDPLEALGLVNDRAATAKSNGARATA